MDSRNNRGIIISVIVIIVIAIAGFALLSRDNSGSTSSTGAPASNTPQATPTTVSVTYDGTSFSPATVTVPRGSTVIFANGSSGTMWVASDPHPVHTDYPGFDELSAAPPGDTYRFTFDRAGTWGYHNHTNPSARGTVVVE